MVVLSKNNKNLKDIELSPIFAYPKRGKCSKQTLLSMVTIHTKHYDENELTSHPDLPQFIDISKTSVNDENGKSNTHYYIISCFCDPDRLKKTLEEMIANKEMHGKSILDIPKEAVVGVFFNENDKYAFAWAAPACLLKVINQPSNIQGIEKMDKVDLNNPNIFRIISPRLSFDFIEKHFAHKMFPSIPQKSVLAKKIIEEFKKGGEHSISVDDEGHAFLTLPSWFYYKPYSEMDFRKSTSVSAKKKNSGASSSDLHDDDDDNEHDEHDEEDEETVSPLETLAKNSKTSTSQSKFNTSKKDVVKPSSSSSSSSSAKRVNTPSSSSSSSSQKKQKSKTGVSNASSDLISFESLLDVNALVRDAAARLTDDLPNISKAARSVFEKISVQKETNPDFAICKMRREAVDESQHNLPLPLWVWSMLLTVKGPDSEVLENGYLSPLTGLLENPTTEYGQAMFYPYNANEQPAGDYMKHMNAMVRHGSLCVLKMLGTLNPALEERSQQIQEHVQSLKEKISHLESAHQEEVEILKAQIQKLQTEVQNAEELTIATQTELEDLKKKSIPKKPAAALDAF